MTSPTWPGLLLHSRAWVLAIEADKTVLLEKEELLRKADGGGIAVVAVNP